MQETELMAKKVIVFLYFVPVAWIVVGLFLLVTSNYNVKTSTVYIARRHFLEEENDNSTAVSLPSHQFDETDCCETLHIAIAVAGRTRDTLLLLKSLLLHRQSPLHLHFVVPNDFIGKVTAKFMTTWKLPHLLFSVHDISSTGTFPGSMDFSLFSKLFLPRILPTDVERVLYLDSQYIIAGDVTELWKIAMQKENRLLSLGIKMVDSLCSGKPLIALFNLKVMRHNHWVDEITQATNTSTSLCKAMKGIEYFKIPCEWDVDLKASTEDHTLSSVQYRAFRWSVSNATDTLPIGMYFKKLIEFISNYDGLLLTYTPISHVRNRSISYDNNEDQEELLMKALEKGNEKLMCNLLKKQSKQVFRTLMYWYGDPHYKPRNNFETTMVTQLSLDRLRTFNTLIKQWNGPISIAMYGTDADVAKFSAFVSTFEVLNKRSNVIVHIVFKQGPFYPVNYLRNIALGAVRTQYVFLNDGDFIPVKGLYNHLLGQNKLIKDKKTLLVIPAFETSKFTLKFPASKRELLQQIRMKLVSQFCVTCAHKTHAPTNYRLWFKARNPYQIEWAQHFEPYVVVRSDVARYDERFMGYGYNKVSQITELKAQGYRFMVIPEAFIIHTPHPPTIDKKIWEYKSFKMCINSIWEGFVSEIKKKYGKDCLKEKKVNTMLVQRLK